MHTADDHAAISTLSVVVPASDNALTHMQAIHLNHVHTHTLYCIIITQLTSPTHPHTYSILCTKARPKWLNGPASLSHEPDSTQNHVPLKTSALHEHHNCTLHGLQDTPHHHSTTGVHSGSQPLQLSKTWDFSSKEKLNMRYLKPSQHLAKMCSL
jgi:hypothetical protein